MTVISSTATKEVNCVIKPVFQSELRDRFLDFGLRVSVVNPGVILAHQVVNSRSRPQRRQHIVFGLRFG